MNKELISKTFGLCGQDGNDISVSETAERDQVVIAIQCNDVHGIAGVKGAIATVRLSADQWGAFCDLKYSVDCKAIEREKAGAL